MLRILIADDHSIVRRGLRQILSEEIDQVEVDEVANTEGLFRKITTQEFDLVICDISMPGQTGLEALPRIKQINPRLPVLIMSIHPEDHYAIRVLKAGASGYLSKDLAPEELAKAVRRVVSGRKYITPEVAEKLASVIDANENKEPHELLSDREFTVLKMLSIGKSLTDIADMLQISINTVSTYRSRILVKMNFKNNAELTLYSKEHDLI